MLSWYYSTTTVTKKTPFLLSKDFPDSTAIVAVLDCTQFIEVKRNQYRLEITAKS